jgi:NAD(P)-dependent dehydrogenase (short-subunit alcohol dehydrogenase family)
MASQGGTAGSRSIVLTGAAGVLGQAMARALTRAGHRVLLTDLAEASLRAVAESCDVAQDTVAVCAADLTTASGPDAVMRVALEAFGRVDMLINNAAFTAFAAWPDGRLVDDPWTLDTAFVHRFFDTNVIAPHALTRLVVPGMIERKWGRIVNVTCSFDTMQRIFPYGATKAALEAYTASVDMRLVNTGVTANTLNPGGPVATELHMSKNPGRKWVEAEVMNAPILWLASDLSNGVPGRRYIGTKWEAHAAWEVALPQASGAMTWRGFGEEALK